MCTKKSIVYEKHCIICEQNNKSAIYYGESGKNMFIRDLGHKRVVKAKDLNTPMVKHCTNVHDDPTNVQFNTIVK